MAEVLIAAAPEDRAHASGLAEALCGLGFKASAEIPAEAEIAKAADETKCVAVLWSSAAPAPAWLAVLATLALERKKLVCVERDSGAAPAPFHAAARIDLDPRERTTFKERFEALAAEIEKLAPTERSQDTLPAAIAMARAAMMPPAPAPRARSPWMTRALVAAALAVIFLVGFGAGRIIQAVRSGALLVASRTPPANLTAANNEPSAPGSAFGVTLADLAALPWRDAAAKLNVEAANTIKAQAQGGDAFAQTLACLGHMSGAEGFLPSPTAARAQCDAASAQNYPAALYYSWTLRRAAPHAGLDEAAARARLAEAARLGWVAAQIDYALVLAPDAHASLANQTEAGRLWLAAADHGDPRGQFYYARWLRDSAAGPRDPAAAAPYLERASQHGQLDATHMLATLYRDGIGVRRDSARARALYERAAAGNHAASMFNLADLIAGGSERDRAQAVALYRSLACMRDERQIQPRAVQRLRALGLAPAACG
jgi:TPR repeat protein